MNTDPIQLQTQIANNDWERVESTLYNRGQYKSNPAHTRVYDSVSSNELTNSRNNP